MGISPYGVNFAVGGATAINHAFFVKNNITMDTTPESMQTQLIWFNEYLKRQGCEGSVSSSLECKAAFEDALIWVGEMGINDYGYVTGSPVPSTTVQKLAISSLVAFLQVTTVLFFLGLGARWF
uniref:Uncharacterized protein MANES_06G114600 n=1 Tax=Rhizophora mucronata TaxID=61149 RepID=A0A2P2NJX6_RHIMU